MNRRMNAIEKNRQVVALETKTPYYKAGDVVESKWGDRAQIVRPERTEWGTLHYAVLITRGSGNVRDTWPAEVIVRKFGRAS